MENTIEKSIELKAPVDRVWQAITDHREFGEWFRVSLSQPFEAGKTSSGNILHKGYEHMIMDVTVKEIRPKSFFSYEWHPYAIDANKDYSAEPTTLVEFRLAPTDGGTLLRITESGFEKLSEERRLEAFPMNDRGWSGQLTNIEKYVAQHP